MTQATINGHTYSDDGTSGRDMLHGGHRTWFLPMVGDVATVAGVVAEQAEQTAIDAANAANAAAATKATSTTSLTVSAGTKTLATQPGKQFTAGNFVTISRTSEPATMMHGVVTSYSGAALVVEVAISAGSGTYADWTIALSGPAGVPGATGDGAISYVAKTTTYTLTAEDKAKLIDCSGTFTLDFQPCATLGSAWSTWVKNSGSGIITLDPYSSESINGSSVYKLYSGNSVLLQCNGTSISIVGNSGRQVARLPILSEETIGKASASVLENIDGDVVDTMLGAVSPTVIHDSLTSLFIAFTPSHSSGNIATSPDGRVWTLRSMPSSQQWVVVTCASGWFACARYGTATAMSSNAGVSWISKTVTPVTMLFAAILGTRVLVVSSNGPTAAYSDNFGTSWTTVTLPSNNGPVAAVGSVFVLISGTPGEYYSSPTALTGSWTARSYPNSFIGTFRVPWVSAKLLSSDTGSLYETSDGISWTKTGDFLYPSSIFGPINGVYALWSTTAQLSATYHLPGLPVVRSSGFEAIAHAYDGFGIHVVSITSGAGKVMVIDSSYGKSGLFEV